MTKSGDVYFFADHPDLPLVDGIYRVNALLPINKTSHYGLEPIVTRGARVPVANKHQSTLVRTFVAFGSPVASYHTSTVVFTGAGTYGSLGVYLVNATRNSTNHSTKMVVVPIVDNLDGVHKLGSFPTSPSVDDFGSFVFNVDTDEEVTSGLYSWSVESRKICMVRSLAETKALNMDIQFNSFAGGSLVYYDTNGTVDELWRQEIF